MMRYEQVRDIQVSSRQCPYKSPHQCPHPQGVRLGVLDVFARGWRGTNIFIREMSILKGEKWGT